MLHWSVHAPTVPSHEAPLVKGDYICALGSQGRDYDTLFAAMRRLKHIQLVVVATAESLQHLSIPDNVKVFTHIPLAQAHNILTHSRLMIVPLRDSQVPCGHVTIVSGMFFKKAMIVTNSRGCTIMCKIIKPGYCLSQKKLAIWPKKLSNCGMTTLRLTFWQRQVTRLRRKPVLNNQSFNTFPTTLINYNADSLRLCIHAEIHSTNRMPL